VRNNTVTLDMPLLRSFLQIWTDSYKDFAPTELSRNLIPTETQA
jgi:hypothetical protein